MTRGPPAAARGPTAGTARCALCGLAYDAASHDACPHCADRFGRRQREALDAHRRGRKTSEWLVWVVAAAALGGMGLAAHWGATLVAPTLSAGRGLTTWAAVGGALLGLLAGWRLRERSSIAESVLAVVALALVASVWLRAALVWANGFNLTGDPHELACEVTERDGQRSSVTCVVAGLPIAGEVSDARAEAVGGRRVTLTARHGRLGYWVVASGTLRSVAEEDAGEDPEPTGE